ncbi:MAG: ATP-binding protein, partial [Deltaproteobacteria bacterium]
MGFDELLLIHGVCPNCRFQKGMKLLADSMATSRVLLEGLGLGKFPMNVKEQAKRREKILSRREIFSKVSNEVKKKASFYFRHEEGAFRKRLPGISGGKDGKRGSPKRRLLRGVIKHKGSEKSVVLKYRPESPWGKIRIDEKKCSACGTCITLCPTGSISYKLDDGVQLFYVNSSLCTNCSLCKEACPRNAIDFEVNLPLSDILEDEAKVVARVELIPCTVCGEMITAEKGNLCFTCQKRQVRP